jgi:hypothetical protein
MELTDRSPPSGPPLRIRGSGTHGDGLAGDAAETGAPTLPIVIGRRVSPVPVPPDLRVGGLHDDRQPVDQQVQVRILPCWVHKWRSTFALNWQNVVFLSMRGPGNVRTLPKVTVLVDGSMVVGLGAVCGMNAWRVSMTSP